MTIELGLLFAAIACIIGVSTFMAGKQSSAKKDGHEWGAFQAELRTDIGYIKRDVSEIKVSVSDSRNDTMAAITSEGEHRRDSIRRLHEKFDAHLVTFHNAPPPIKYPED